MRIDSRCEGDSAGKQNVGAQSQDRLSIFL
jgi:hypothetical protein